MEALYREAANVIELAKSKKGSIKGLCFASSYGNKKKLYALVCQTVTCKFNALLAETSFETCVKGGLRPNL